jgi:lipopolysaccharide export LptBFGC system permease protein LptF
MSFQQLREHLRLTRRSGYDVTHLRVALYAKTAMPLAPLVMVLIGLPFAFGAGRKGTLYGLGIALGLVIAYWAVFAVFNGLGLEGVVPAFLSAWAPNVLFALSGVYLLLSVRS